MCITTQLSRRIPFRLHTSVNSSGVRSTGNGVFARGLENLRNCISTEPGRVKPRDCLTCDSARHAVESLLTGRWRPDALALLSTRALWQIPIAPGQSLGIEIAWTCDQVQHFSCIILTSKHKFCEQPLAHLTDRRSDTQTQTGTIFCFLSRKKIFLKLGLSYDNNTRWLRS
jgi:hypothetical protein